MNNTQIPHASRLEEALSLTFAENLNIPIDIHTSWQAVHCPEHLLPYLAWSLSVDDWDDNWSADSKRAVINESIFVHQQKGTLASIRRVMQAAGFGDIDIIENQSLKTWNGELTFEGLETFDHEEMHWAEYKIRLKSPITRDEAERIRRILKNTAPARCHLVSFKFDEVAFRWDGEITFDGNYTFGEVE